MSQNLFKWKHFESDIIMVCVRWYLKYPLSYRMLVEMMQERGLNITHTTIMRWVHQYSLFFDERVRKHLKPTNDSWRMDETYLKIKGKNAYLYRAVDSEGKTINLLKERSSQCLDLLVLKLLRKRFAELRLCI